MRFYVREPYNLQIDYYLEVSIPLPVSCTFMPEPDSNILKTMGGFISIPTIYHNMNNYQQFLL